MKPGCLRVALDDAAQADLVTDLLWSRGATAISQRDDGGVVLEAGFVNDETARSARDAVAERVPSARLELVDATAALDAALDAWKAHTHPVRVGRIHVRYPWSATEDDPPGAGECVVVLDPSLAFGSGSHPSTLACLRVIDRLATRGSSVLDVGCGSGVLAVTAARLGASPVVAVDVETLAVDATRANAVANEVVISASTTPVQEVDGTYDLVLANIGAATLVDLAADIGDRVRPGGTLVLAGLLEMQASAVVRAYARLGLQLGNTAAEDGWVAYELRRASTTPSP